MFLIELPEELIAHIATSTDARAILNLCSTSRKLRSACYDSVVLKGILSLSQQYYWRANDFNVAAIANFAGHDASIWMRYALADLNATSLGARECPLESPDKFLRWLPELLILKHPFMYHPCWRRFLRDPVGQSSKQIFCQAVAILACASEMPQVHKSLRMQEDPYLTTDTSRKAYLWAFCAAALHLKTHLESQKATWLCRHAPYVDIPSVSQTLMDIGDRALPLPFGEDRQCETNMLALLEDDTGWELWYRQRSAAMATSSYLCDGDWEGYYTHPNGLDPPMVDIRFSIVADSAQIGHSPLHCETPITPNQGQSTDIRIKASSCVDGIRAFELNCKICTPNNKGEITVFARKQYLHAHTAWDWDCRLTPFGIHGFWGKWLAGDIPQFSRRGLVWLWKRSV